MARVCCLIAGMLGGGAACEQDACGEIRSDGVVMLQVKAEIVGKPAVDDDLALIQESDALLPARTYSGTTASLTENGYRQVAELRSDREMRTFAERLLSSHDLVVTESGEGDFSGFLPWFSGIASVQSLKQLLLELTTAPWVVERTMLAEGAAMASSRETSSTAEDKIESSAKAKAKEQSDEEVETQAKAKEESDEDVEDEDVAGEHDDLEDEESTAGTDDAALYANKTTKKASTASMPSLGWSMGPRVGSSGQKYCFDGEASSVHEEMTLEDAQVECDADEKCNFIWSHGCDMSWKKCYANAPMMKGGDQSSCTLIKPGNQNALLEEGGKFENTTHAVQHLILQALLESDIDKVPDYVVEYLDYKRENDSEESTSSNSALVEEDSWVKAHELGFEISEEEDGEDVDEEDDVELDYVDNGEDFVKSKPKKKNTAKKSHGREGGSRIAELFALLKR